MKIQTIPLDAIKPYWRNPRNNSKAIEAVKASIAEFGFNQPLVVDKDHIIIAGHTRYKALMELGHISAPAIVVDLDPQRAKAYRIADNKTNELAEWDMDKLIPELREIADAVDMQVYFGTEDFDALMADASADFATATQAAIDKAGDEAASQFDAVAANASSDQVEIICPHCGETAYVPREHLLREMAAKVE